MIAKPITSAEVMATLIEISPDETWLFVCPGQFQSGRELAQQLAGRGFKVRFLQWPGGVTVAVRFPATQREPSIHEYMRAYRQSVECLRGAITA